MAGIKQVLGRIYKVMPKRHPDVYKTMQEYANSRGMKMEDLMATAATVYMGADATPEEKANLEEIMARRSSSGGGGGGSQKANFSMMTSMMSDFAKAMSDVFTAMNTARAGMSVNAMISDFTATAKGMEEIKKIGSEGGSGSIGDQMSNAVIQGIFRQLGAGTLQSSGLGKRLGHGSETKSPDDVVADKK